jgi:hypothetical protein
VEVNKGYHGESVSPSSNRTDESIAKGGCSWKRAGVVLCIGSCRWNNLGDPNY